MKDCWMGGVVIGMAKTKKAKKAKIKPSFLIEYKGELWIGSAYSRLRIFLNGKHLEDVPVRIDCLKRIYAENQLSAATKAEAEKVMETAIEKYQKEKMPALVANLS